MASSEYRFQLLRYAPNAVSGEFYNVAVVLRDGEGRIVEARFATEFRRLACHPAVEMEYLQQLRDEFEERRLLGEGFTAYLAEIERHLSNTLELSDERAFFGGDVAAEMDRLVRTYVATPAGLGGEDRGPETAPDSRTAVRRTMRRTFERLGLFRNGDGVQREVEVAYSARKLVFKFDFGYRPVAGGERLLHALGRRDDVGEAAKLCFVYQRIAAGNGYGARELTAVLADPVSEEARELLAESRVETVPVGEVEALGLRVREELGL